PKVSLHYNPGENSVQYATVTRGYKSGGFNSTIEREEDLSFGPEYSTNYEIGFKQRVLDKSLNIHGALYYIDWEDQQVYQPVPSGQGSMLKNAGESHSQGAELEIKYKPVRNLILFSNFAYTEAKYDLYERDAETDYSGNYIPYIPRMTFNLGADYRHIFRSALLDEMRLHCSYRGIGKHFWNDENTLKEDYYGTLNVKVAALAGDIRVSLWGKNIFDNDFNAFLFEFSPLRSSFAQRGLPARFGMSVSMSFN
ncbi:MAG: TonB-dependent receptor, partial [Candidatus Krumholzibacteriota bacterium]